MLRDGLQLDWPINIRMMDDRMRFRFWPGTWMVPWLTGILFCQAGWLIAS
jgi:hypothetical protein